MSPSAYRRACACLLALLLTPTAGFASAFAASGAASSSASGSASHAVVAKKKKKKRSKKTAVCSKRSKRAKAKARKSDVSVGVPGVTTVTLPLPPLPGGTTTTPGGTTTTPGGTTTTPGGTTTTPTGSGGGGSTTTTGSQPGTTTTTGTKPKPGSSTTTGSSSPTVKQGSSPSSSTPSTTTKAKSKAKKKKAKKHRKARHHKKAKKHAKKKHAKKRVAKKHKPKVVKKHTTKKHGKKVTKKKVVKKKKSTKKHSTKKHSTKKHSTKKKVTKKKKSTKKRKSTPQAPTQQAPQQQCTPATQAPLPPVGGFTVGMVSGPAAAWEAGLTDKANLHPKVVRVPFQIGASVSSVQNQVAGLASKGEQALLLAEFPGRIPSQSEAQSLAGWAKAVGPGGTFWAGRSDGALAVRYIEFGNETNMSYQFGGVSSGSSYIARAQSYAQRARDAADAIRAANPSVGLLAIADNGGCGCSQWVDGMFSAVPDLNKHIGGWSAHPYGPSSRYKPIMDRAMNDVTRHGDTTLPFFLTEYGISTNNGTCLDSNYNWPNCMTYQQAGDSMRNAILDLKQSYPRIAQIYIFEQRDMANDPNGREANFGAIKSDGSLKGAYTDTIRNITNTYRG
jgi:hypothetical protein